jgi:hypothetical protein
VAALVGVVPPVDERDGDEGFRQLELAVILDLACQQDFDERPGERNERQQA